VVQEREFSYEIQDEPGRLVLHGDLDEGATVQVRMLLKEVTDGLTRDLTIDLTDVDLLPSSAVGVLANAQDTAGKQGAAVTFVAADGTIAARVLTICGLAYDEA
jgi:anti-anti-sigma factor